MVVTVLVVYFYDPLADWELWFTATAQDHERILYCIAQKSKFEIPGMAPTECISLSHHCKIKISESNHHKLGTVCMLESLGISKKSDFLVDGVLRW